MFTCFFFGKLMPDKQTPCNSVVLALHKDYIQGGEG